MLLQKQSCRGWGYSSVVWCLPRMLEALSSIPTTTKKKKKKKNRNKAATADFCLL
jgi:hypothetical protein